MTMPLRLIKRKGKKYTFKRVTSSDYDTSTGTVAETTTNYTAWAVRVEFSNYEKNQSNVQAQDYKLLAECADFAIDDELSDGHRIKAVMPYAPADVVLAYELHLTK